MPTIPTGKMEQELRRLYMRWVHQLPKHENDLHDYVAKFQRQSTDLIEKMGGDIARLGVLADFPAPRRLDLSLHVGTIYSDMELAAISAQIGTGLNPTDTARALVRAGVDKSYRRLERLARTETVRAYWKNAWDSIEGLGLVMVWGAENGPRTCEWCKERDGLVMDSSNVRDHPNGRCTPLPTHPSQVDYRGSVRDDGEIYQDPAWTKKSKAPEDVFPQGKMESLADQRVDRTNPGQYWFTGESKAPYQENCTRVVSAAELRTRGLDVVANGVRMEPGEAVRAEDLANMWGGIFQQARNQTELRRLMMEAPVGARFFVANQWKYGFGGHVWNAEMVLVNGRKKIRFFDLQKVNNFGNPENYLRESIPKSLQVMRVDDLTPTRELWTQGWVTTAETVKEDWRKDMDALRRRIEEINKKYGKPSW